LQYRGFNDDRLGELTQLLAGVSLTVEINLKQ